MNSKYKIDLWILMQNPYGTMQMKVQLHEDSTLQLNFKKWPQVELWCNIKEKYWHLSEMILK